MGLNVHTYWLHSSIWIRKSIVFQVVGYQRSLYLEYGEKSTAKNYHPISLLSVISKVFEKFVNKRVVDHVEIF